jgi:site-specific DNA recombinase
MQGLKATDRGQGGDVRVATYTRISTDEVNQPYSLGAQEEKLASYIASQDGWERVASYSDQASGAKLERPGLQRCLAEAALHRFDVLLVYRLDRLCRSSGLLADILSRLDRCKVGFRSATETFETTTPSGMMQMQMLGVFAEFERASIIERVVMGMARKAAEGKWVGGTQPIGYRRANDGQLVVEPTEAAVVVVIFDRYVHSLKGSHEIANWLNKQGYRTRAGRAWQFKSVLTVLRNRVYLGEVGWRGKWYRAKHAPVVEQGIFDKAQLLLTERADDPAKRAAHGSDYLLSGLISCSCGARYTGTPATGRHRTYRYYTCGARQRYGSARCSAKRFRAEAIEEAVLKGLVALLEDGALINEAVRRARERAGATRRLVETEIDGIQHELSSIDQAIDRYLASFEQGSLPEALCGPRLRALGDQAVRLRARRDELLAELEAGDLGEQTEEQLVCLREDLDTAIREGSPDHVKALVHALVHEVRVEGANSLRPIYKIPAGDKPAGLSGAVRMPSRSVEVSGLEPPTSTLRKWIAATL